MAKKKKGNNTIWWVLGSLFVMNQIGKKNDNGLPPPTDPGPGTSAEPPPTGSMGQSPRESMAFEYLDGPLQ